MSMPSSPAPGTVTLPDSRDLADVVKGPEMERFPRFPGEPNGIVVVKVPLELQEGGGRVRI